MRTIVYMLIVVAAVLWVVYFTVKLVQELREAFRDETWKYIPIIAAGGLAVIWVLSLFLPWLAGHMGSFGEFFMNECGDGEWIM